MKKNNILILVLSGAYILSFIMLFVRMRTMSNSVMDELSQNNVYYLIGFTFVVGLTALFFPILAISKEESLLTEVSSKSIIDYEEAVHKQEEFLTEENDSMEVELKRKLELIVRSHENKVTAKDKLLWEFCNAYEISQALWFSYSKIDNDFRLEHTFAYSESKNSVAPIVEGDGLTGQAILDRTPYYIKEVPEGYIKITSGLGEVLPKSLLIIPCIKNDSVSAVYELASLKDYTKEEFDSLVSICSYVDNLI